MPDVVALAHALGRVVVLPEHLEQLLVARLRRVEHDADGLGVAGPAGARLLVRRVGREAALVADGGRPDAGLLPERLLLAPEAAERELGDLEAVRIGAGDRRARARCASSGCRIGSVRPGSARSAVGMFVLSRLNRNIVTSVGKSLRVTHDASMTTFPPSGRLRAAAARFRQGPRRSLVPDLRFRGGVHSHHGRVRHLGHRRGEGVGGGWGCRARVGRGVP